MTIAVIGAGGFVGGHVLRVLRALGHDARAVVRNPLQLADDPNRRVADARDVYQVRDAIAGCEGVVHSVVGPPDVILGTLAPVYAAAQAVGVRRMVYMSTGSVHGQRPAPRTDETSALTVRHAFPYNTAKVRAERKLRRLRGRGTVELVMLRPTIVFGPGSRWVFDFAAALLDHTPFIVDGARGVCNSIYVDNLGHAVSLALTATDADGEAFLVGDEEAVTWSDLYRPIAAALGYDFDALPSFNPTDPSPGFGRLYLEPLRSAETAQAIIRHVPAWMKSGIRSAMRVVRGTRSRERVPASGVDVAPEGAVLQGRPAISDEIIALHRCAWRLPHDKARRLLGYRAPTTFDEGCRRSVQWLMAEWLPARARTRVLERDGRPRRAS